ncbi:glycosyltransferase [bacterium]|nr:glycosyltransferase [bacterium]
MKASIITPHYNSHHTLLQLKTALQSQTFPLDNFEWIIIDDGSQSPLPEEITSNESSLNIVTNVFQENRGRAAARNKGIEIARGEIIVFLDADMVPATCWLEMMVRGVSESGGILVGKLGLHPSLPMTAYMRYYHSRGAAKIQGGCEIPGKYFTAANSALPAKIARDSGGFDRAFKAWGGEDLEFGLRLEEHGMKLYHEPRAKAWHFHKPEWTEMERRYRIYGREVIPMILDRHPQAYEMLSLNYLENPLKAESVSQLLKNSAVRLLCRQNVYNLVNRMVVSNDKFPWQELIFDFMIFTLYSTAYRKTLE